MNQARRLLSFAHRLVTLKQLTHDHTVAQELADTGLIDTDQIALQASSTFGWLFTTLQNRGKPINA